MKTERYFDEARAMAGFSGNRIETVLETAACRYMGANPRYEYMARPFFTGEICRNKDYRYEADFSHIFPGASLGSYVYAWGRYPAEAGGALKFTLIPKGPVKIWMNGGLVYGTGVEAERHDNTPVDLTLPVKEGWNHLILRFTRTQAGFGAEFGTWLGKLDYYFFRGLSRPELPEIEGFDYTAPLEAPLEHPGPESLGPLCLPLPGWTEEEKNRGLFGRIFPEARPGERVAARTVLYSPVPGAFEFSGFSDGNCAIYAGKKQVFSLSAPGPFRFDHTLTAGYTPLTLVSECPGGPWDFCLKILPAAGTAAGNLVPGLTMANPFFTGGEFPWAYAGPFRETAGTELLEFDREALVGRGGEKTWWRLDGPGLWVRLYNENPLYGHWNYPLGVTLYGLIETARFFENSGETGRGRLGAAFGAWIAAYVKDHAAMSARTLDYALFDKERFGGATAVHHLLSSIDSLDDCGSFGSFVLELAKDHGSPEFGRAVEYTADHILRRQDRLPEGCFYRRKQMHRFHNLTMWADDLYMSVPFLCRYSAYKNDPSVLDTAALQFEGFKKYLFMEDCKLMAHVYDFERGMNTGIPWGRGNGWTIFSLSELLLVLPETHPRRPFLLDFFRTLASGYLACQDESGMWRQVLNMAASYIETSCTAMFICAFSRGLRLGWFGSDGAVYRAAAEKAWRALEKYSIDKDGNVWGVCRGSEFSFNPRYYAEHLLPRLNDTHGIGIVLLAGVELLKMRQSCV
ncbi:MAG: glycoside hydrolase family 88 protein [Treponema sp.]|jgi:rhamnogalacturonyl hydrolase YesR|nr:glycoside hydrolase family 88 protein [Treponema sp.]